MYICHVCNVELKSKGKHEKSKRHLTAMLTFGNGVEDEKLECTSELKMRCKMLEEKCNILEKKYAWVNEDRMSLNNENSLLEEEYQYLWNENALLKEDKEALQEENNLLKMHLKVYDFLKDAYTTMASIIFSSGKTYQKIIEPRCEETDCSDCFICGESKAELFWTCSTCLNQTCVECASTWRKKSDKCPFCRSQI
jgi:hypothetical protein